MVLAQIHNRFGELTEAEKKAASCVLEDPKRVISLSVQQFADLCGTAPSAVVRFCKSIGQSGFAELKLSLAKELGGRKEEEALPAFQKEDDTETVFRKVFQSGIGTLRDTLAMLDFERAQKMADVLAGAGQIMLFGVGTSSVIATDAQYRFSQLGLRASACTDILFMNVAAVNLSKGDVALAISHSGRTKEVVKAMRRAKAAGASTLAITSFADSLLFRESDIALSVYADEVNYPVEAVSSRIAHFCVIDSLMMALATKRYDGFAERIAARNAVLDEIRFDKKNSL